MSVEFVRDSPTAETFNGRWQVWIGPRCWGVVRRAADGKSWGYEARPYGHYRNGQTCEGGFSSRRAAAHYMIETMLAAGGA